MKPNKKACKAPSWIASCLPGSHSWLLALAAAVLLSVQGCGTSAGVRQGAGKPLLDAQAAQYTPASGQELATLLNELKVLAETENWQVLELKGKAAAQSAEKERQFTYRIKIKRNELVWASLGWAGVEGVRVLVTRDSILMMNRLEKTYAKYSIAKVSEFTGFEVGLPQLQQLLLARMPAQAETPAPTLEESRKYSQLHYILPAGTTTWYLAQQTKLLHAARVVDNATTTSVGLSYSQFKRENGVSYPGRVFLNVVRSGKTSSLVMENARITLDPEDATFTFKIPNSYVPQP